MLFMMFVAIVGLVVINNLNSDLDATYELRGRYKSSQDGKTYLVIEDNNGGQCGPLLVDKKEWQHDFNVKGEVEPGEHIIECGTSVGIIIKGSSTYFFDYWGP